MTSFRVVIPTLNEEARVADAVRSARCAPQHAVRVVVVDGGSTDGTIDQARAAGADVRFSEPGRARQLNIGAADAIEDCLLFLHADCRLPPGWDDQIADAFAAGNVIAGGFRQRIDARGLRWRFLEWGNGFRGGVLRSLYGDQAMFVRRDVFQRLDGFPEVPILEDWLLSRSLRAERGRMALLPGPLAVSARRWERQGIVRQTLRNWSILWRARRGADLHELAREYRNVR
ncbi:MAG: TIGR04283 family arsenosugar biosynthesis glycosyltransferase [Planctomyces sp.]|nr:TIGR04283 family arsenosugar biosynthesis glycosyltransferase [Planctomyces sp.]